MGRDGRDICTYSDSYFISTGNHLHLYSNGISHELITKIQCWCIKDLKTIFLNLNWISNKISNFYFSTVGESCISHHGTSGLCKPAINCSHAMSDYINGVQNTKCSYVKNLFVICCLDDVPTEEQAGKPRNNSGSVSRKSN